MQIGYTLETCWWVPALFGTAGVILGVSHPLLDDWRKSQPESQFVLPTGRNDLLLLCWRQPHDSQIDCYILLCTKFNCLVL